MLRSSYESVPEQLQKCYGTALSRLEQLYVFRGSFKSSVAVMSSRTVITLPEQLGYADFLHIMALIRFHN